MECDKDHEQIIDREVVTLTSDWFINVTLALLKAGQPRQTDLHILPK